jgi:hypothetical protein
MGNLGLRLRVVGAIGFASAKRRMTRECETVAGGLVKYVSVRAAPPEV